MIPDWNIAPRWAQYTAMDIDALGARWFWYAEKPFYNPRLEMWLPSEGIMEPVGIPGDIAVDPTTTLEARP